MTSRVVTTLLAALLIWAPVTARASVLVSESFDYAVPSALDGANGGTGWAGAWFAGSSTVPTYSVIAQDITPPAGYGTPIGAQGFIDPGATNDDSGGATPDIRRDLASTIDMDVAQTLYFSALIRREDITNGGGTEHSQYLRFNDAAGTNLVALGHSSTEDFRLALNNVADDSATVDFQIGVDYLVVGKLTLNPSGMADVLEASLFTAGDALVEPAVWAHMTSADLNGVISQLHLNPQRRAGRTFIDEIRIGETFGDVTVVPEPASVVALGLCALLWSSRRR
jgi:hypothetical protein